MEGERGIIRLKKLAVSLLSPLVFSERFLERAAICKSICLENDTSLTPSIMDNIQPI